MEDQKYKIVTIGDLSNVITAENFANFMTDFTDVMVKIVQIKKQIKELYGEYPTTPICEEFTWIDDSHRGVKEIHLNGEKISFPPID
jgi:hypothetical protein